MALDYVVESQDDVPSSGVNLRKQLESFSHSPPHQLGFIRPSRLPRGYCGLEVIKRNALMFPRSEVQQDVVSCT